MIFLVFFFFFASIKTVITLRSIRAGLRVFFFLRYLKTHVIQGTRVLKLKKKKEMRSDVYGKHKFSLKLVNGPGGGFSFVC